jgi:hypothetical protein
VSLRYRYHGTSPGKGRCDKKGKFALANLADDQAILGKPSFCSLRVSRRIYQTTYRFQPGDSGYCGDIQ